MNIYLASPFFKGFQTKRVERMAEILRAKGHEVFVPMEHQNKHLEFGSYAWRKATWQSDVDAIERADAVYAIVSDGNYSDDGTAWEIGYAHAKGKPILIFNENGEEPVNLMISDSLTTYITTWDALIALKDEFSFDLPKMEYTGEVV
ncbi:nucleoside 2-deoxyribosyltransferase [Priestia endophytica]|uniref:nucleoside 2-deoxyribosyltransferase n=1 Tax=Priestia endophytica TaxID=135735 RepID=UPI003D26D561